MKRIAFIFALIAFAACQKEVSPDGLSKNSDVVQGQAVEQCVLSDNPVCFLSDKDFSVWSKIESLEDRFAACNISEAEAKTMTTDAIVRSILRYPLNYIIFAYNDPMDAVKLVLENSNLHQELLLRNDAAETLLRYFEKTKIDMNQTLPAFDETYQTVTYSDEMFLEYLIASGAIKGFDNPSILDKLLAVVDNKTVYRHKDSSTYSNYSILPLNTIVNSVAHESAQQSSTCIFTYFGQVLPVELFSEFSAAEINNITSSYEYYYPMAEVIRPASNTYNCHSYAWYNQSTSNHYWLNSQTSGGTLLLQRFWTDDYYYVTTETNAEKVFYASGDHSAVPLSTNSYISKWGSAPLMKHSPSYCPYISTNRHYYAHRTYLPYDITSSIVGDTQINVNTIHNYSLPHSYYGMSVSWSSEPLPGVPGTCQSTVNSDGTCSFSADAPGAYYLYLEGYRNGVQLLAGSSIIIVGYF